ncbi:hypothetical protein MASR2M78_22170 [Treponema sp.]
MKRSSILGAALSLCMLLLPALLGAQETARYLTEEKETEKYADIHLSLLSLAGSLSAASIPERLFLDRLKEGVRKHAPSARLLMALESDVSRFLFVAALIDSSALKPSAETREKAIYEASIAFRLSLTKEEYRTAFAMVNTRGGGVERII